MTDIQHSFVEYLGSSKDLFRKLFGDEAYDRLANEPIKEIEWDGIEIQCTELISGSPNIQDRFRQEWIAAYKDTGVSMLDLYIKAVFEYGYEQSYNVHKSRYDEVVKSMNEALKSMKP
jgi:hypothetical protein